LENNLFTLFLFSPLFSFFLLFFPLVFRYCLFSPWKPHSLFLLQQFSTRFRTRSFRMPSFGKYIVAIAAGFLTLGNPVAAADYEDYKWGLPKENCDIGNYAELMGASGNGGVRYCFSKHHEGLLIRKIYVEADKKSVRALGITWTDGSYEQVGQMNYAGGNTRKGTLELDPTKDTITQFELWKTSKVGQQSGGIGRVRITTSANKNLDVSNDHSDQPADYKAQLNGGSLLGIRGVAAGSIDGINLILSKSKIRSRRIIDMKLNPSIDEINSQESVDDRGFKLEKIDSWQFTNENMENPVEFGMKKGIKLTKGTAITMSESTSFGVSQGFSFTASMGVPEIASAELTTSMGMEWTNEESTSTTESKIEEDLVEVDGRIQLNSGESATCEAFTYSAKSINVQWRGLVELKFEDDTTLQFSSDGDYMTAGHTKGKIVCKSQAGDDISPTEGAGGLGDSESRVLSAGSVTSPADSPQEKKQGNPPQHPEQTPEQPAAGSPSLGETLGGLIDSIPLGRRDNRRSSAKFRDHHTKREVPPPKEPKGVPQRPSGGPGRPPVPGRTPEQPSSEGSRLGETIQPPKEPKEVPHRPSGGPGRPPVPGRTPEQPSSEESSLGEQISGLLDSLSLGRRGNRLNSAKFRDYHVKTQEAKGAGSPSSV
jgi:hypothetical protein